MSAGDVVTEGQLVYAPSLPVAVHHVFGQRASSMQDQCECQTNFALENNTEK
jgi:hypothetical protein